MSSKAPVIVFGDSSAAVFVISQLLKREEAIIWAKGSGARLTPVLPFLKSELALGALLDSSRVLSEEVDENPVEKGTFHRVFRNKAFKMPAFKKSHDRAVQQQAFEQAVWAPEQLSLGVDEFRIRGLTPALAEERLRAQFETHPSVTLVPTAPVLELEIYEHGGEIQFAGGLKTAFSQFYFCDHVQELKQLPKLATVLKHQVGTIKASQRMSALQVIFLHKEDMPHPQDTGFVVPMNRDAGEEFDRDVLGYFLDSKRSIWTVFMKAEETEENHEIMKKLRKLKQSLNRAFGAETDGAIEFTKTVEKEQVRFESGFIVTEHEVKASELNTDFVFVSDAFGFTHALEVLARKFGIAPLEFDPAATLSSGLDLDSIEMPHHLKPSETPVTKEL
jgi:hypothetical protein